MVMLWLVPFDSIQARGGGPIDLKLDRLVVFVTVTLWLIVIALGAHRTTKVRVGAIGVAMFAFVTVAVLSILLHLQVLVGLGELSLGGKKLALLLSYVAIFGVVVTTIRPTEVKPFIRLFVGLACLTALGTVYQYRFGGNLFFSWSGKIFGSAFAVFPPPVSSVFERRSITGPTTVGLTLTTMLAMALPFAVIELLNVRGRPNRKLLVAVVTGIILAGCFATLKKTAGIVPLVVLSVLVMYRPRQMARLIPLGLVLGVFIQGLVPGALRTVEAQIVGSDSFTTTTTDDRKSDYPATAPDILARPAFGRGYGTYDHAKYRVLDNQLLLLAVEVGLIGLLAWLATICSAFWRAHRMRHSPDHLKSSYGVAAAAAMAGFGVSCGLFDALAFPQVPYMFFLTAGFIVVLGEPPAGSPRTRLAKIAHHWASRSGGPRPAVHLTASAGGHLDLLDHLRSAFEGYRLVWVTSQSQRADSLERAGEDVRTLPLFQSNRLGRIKNTVAAALLVFRERPLVIVTSGAGSVVPFCLLAKATGTKIIFVETMARVKDASRSGRVLSRFADVVLVQWDEMRAVYPGAVVCRPALWESGERTADQQQGTLVAVGTHSDQFDRLLRAVDEAVERGALPGPVTAQVGSCGYTPRSFTATKWLTPDELEAAVARSQVVVCHGGSGIVSAALRVGHRPLVMARLARHHEHVDDHQLQLVEKLGDLGLVVPVRGSIDETTVHSATRQRAPLSEAVDAPPMAEVLRACLSGQPPRSLAWMQ